MAQTHTPGPWEVVKIKREAGGWTPQVHASVRETSALFVCELAGAYPAPAGETQANARLIAAAPDLLAACKAIDRADSYTHERGEALAKVRAAIARATA